MRSTNDIELLSRFVNGKDLISLICTYKEIKPVTRINVSKERIGEFADVFDSIGFNHSISKFGFFAIDDKNLFSNVSKREYNNNQDIPNQLNLPHQHELVWYYKAAKVHLKTFGGEYSSQSNSPLKYMYISMKKELCEKAREYDQSVDNKSLGRLLGYPSCCIDFFEKNYSVSNPDLIRDITKNSKKDNEGFPCYTNYAARYFGYSIISHFPCSWNCKESLKLANSYVDCAIKYFPKQVNKIIYFLKKSVLYSDKVVILFEDEVPRYHNFTVKLENKGFVSNTDIKFNKIIYKNTVSRLYFDNRYKFSIRNPLLLRFK